jgi:hypothetical protein
MDGTDLAKVVSTTRPYVWEVGERSHEPVAVVGVKTSRRASTSSPTTTASSRTFCASCVAKAARSQSFRRRRRRKHPRAET